MGGAASTGISATELMDFIVDLMPSPAESEAATAMDSTIKEDITLPCDGDGPLAALIFKTTADPFVGKLSYVRVYSGTFMGDSQMWNASKGEPERVAQIYMLTGKSQEPVDELAAGDMGAVAKLSTVDTGDTLSQKGKPADSATPRVPKARFPDGRVPQVQGGPGQDVHGAGPDS